MVASLTPAFTVKEYLALEAVSETRHEYCGGRIIGMAGAELAHNQIVQNVRHELGKALEDGPCRILSADQRVRADVLAEYFYPDVVVVCAEPALVEPRPQSLTNPEVIVEVLSETTERYDRGDKGAAYRTIPTLADYVLVSSVRREVEHYQRASDGSWTLRTYGARGTCALANGVLLDVDKLYRLVPDVA